MLIARVRQVMALAFVLFIALSFPVHAEKILKRGNGGEPYSLDPHRAVMTAENNIIGDMLLGLYTEDANGMPILGAAESVETSSDGLTWTFKIRKHNWSDGTPVTAHDFVYAYQRVLAPETAAEYASILYPLKNALAFNKGSVRKEKLGVSAPDASTFVITLEHAAPFLPQLLTHYTTFPVPKSVVEKYGSEWTRAGKMVVNGPYVLKEWRPHDHILLVKNDKFYDAAHVKVDQVYYYPTDDDNTSLKRFRAGELDTQERWPTSEHKWLQVHIPTEANQIPQLTINYVSFNLKKKPFDDIRVRQALSMAIDADTLADNVLQSAYGKAAYGFLPPGTVNVDNLAKVSWYGTSMDQRRQQARKLLQAAGFHENNPLRFTYRFINVPDVKKAAVALQSMWSEVGVKAELQASEAKVHWNLLEVHDFQVAYNTWALDYNDAKNFFFTFQVAAEQLNSSLYSSAEFERYLDAADGEPDGAKRATLLGQAHALMLKDLPAVPLMFPYQRHLVKNYILNWYDNPRDVNRTRWVDIGDKSLSKTSYEPDADGDSGTWSWLTSWFSSEAWSNWWNS
ncbi:MAG: peptide ABC transporter substrate-binding protein [Micropepsaceae bacterium]